MKELAELLLDAPAGIKLYCPVWGEVVFQGISDDINVLTDKGEFDGYGRMDPNGECLLFPSRDRHDWEEWQEVLFRPNDVVSCDERVFIYVGTVHYNVFSTYNMMAADGKQLLLPVTKCQFATPRETEKFFKTMKSHGLQWNSILKKAERIPTEHDKPKDEETLNGKKNKSGMKKNEKVTPLPGPELPTDKDCKQPTEDSTELTEQGEKSQEREEKTDETKSEWTRFLELAEMYKKEYKRRGTGKASVNVSDNIKNTFEHLRLSGVHAPIKSIVSAALHAFLENNADEIQKMNALGLKTSLDSVMKDMSKSNEPDKPLRTI